MNARWANRAARPPVCRNRVDQFAQLLADGMRVSEITAALGLTKGEAASTMRRIKTELGPQAV